MKTIQNYLPRMPRRCGACRTNWAMATRKWPNWPDWTRPSLAQLHRRPRAARPGRQRLFYMMARQVLDEAQWRRVLAAMREAGARFDYDDPAPASAPASGDPAPPEAAEEHKFGMLLVSGGGAFHEMEQLREFAHFVHEAGVSGLVRRTYYDSGIDLCRFTLADDPTTGEAARDRIFDAARKTITRFEFGGRIYQGGIPPESDG